MIPYNWIEEAVDRISPHIRHTELTYFPEEDIYIKWENHQVTGSFKIRGALNKILGLNPLEQSCELVTASAGNHGQGVAYAGKLVGAKVTIFASEHASPMKVEAMRASGADVQLVPGGYGEAEKAGLAYAHENQRVWISAYNDEQVIAGQGTLGVEIGRDLPSLRECTWVTPVGGGGLISGISASLAEYRPRPHLIGVQSEASPFFHAIYHTGSQSSVVELESLADGLAGPVEEGSITIPIVKESIDDLVLVSEEEIARAIAFSWRQYSERIEGSAAAALAAVLFRKVRHRPAVVIISGGNIEENVVQQCTQNY